MVWRSSQERLLPANQISTQSKSPVCLADQSYDREGGILRLSNGCLASGLQQKHRSEDFSRSRDGRFVRGLLECVPGSRRYRQLPLRLMSGGRQTWPVSGREKTAGASLALVIDCHTRELLGWHLSRTGKATTATAALEHALISRFGTLGRVDREFLLRSDNGLVFTSRHFTAIVKSYGLEQEFIAPHCPQQNGMVERVIRTMKEQCIHRHRFKTIQHANRVIADWIFFLQQPTATSGPRDANSG